MWIQLLLAMEINWTTFNIFLSILIKKKIKLPYSAMLAWLMFVTIHKDRTLKTHYFW